jgi:polyisoprenoid-binding protein YceI
MRRLVLAASIALIAAAAAQPANQVWQLNSDAANITANKSKFGLTAGALEWNNAKPEATTFALSLDTTSLGDDGLKTQLDAGHNPEMRIITTTPGRKSGDKISLPAAVTIKDVTKPVTLEVSYKNSGREIDMHAEATIRGSDFKLKGGDIALVMDAPFKPALGQ